MALDGDDPLVPFSVLDFRAVVVVGAGVSTPASPAALTGEGALGVGRTSLDARADADAGAAPDDGAPEPALAGSRTPNAAPTAPDTPPVAAAVPTCAALFTGAAAADTAWWPTNADCAKCPPVKETIFSAISGLNAAMNKRPTPPIRLAIAEAIFVAPAPCKR